MAFFSEEESGKKKTQFISNTQMDYYMRRLWHTPEVLSAQHMQKSGLVRLKASSTTRAENRTQTA
jgi:hypothetical protein